MPESESHPANSPCAKCGELPRTAYGSYCGPCKSVLTRESAQRHAEKPCNSCGSAPRALNQTRCLPCAKAANDECKRRLAGTPCSTCGENPRRPISTQCGPCANEATRQYRLRFPEGKDPIRRRLTLLNRRVSKYGLTIDEFQALIVAQDNRCAICGRDMGNSQNIDHNHATGEVRGLLCSPCNTGLGIFEDEPHLLEVAAAYLYARN